jgi:hypothetical protein
MVISLNEAKKAIENGKTLLVAGEESLLKALPKGKWVGGTIPYFMADEGGVTTREKLFATELSPEIAMETVVWYGEKDLPRIAKDSPDPGFSFIIIPATSKAHFSYAQNAPSYPGIFMKSIIGWIAGVHLDDLGKKPPTVFNGLTGESSTDKAVVMHLRIPKGKIASIGIVNLFKQGPGDAITFDTEGFSVKDCFVNGTKANFADYIVSKKIDTKLPLVANYSGTMVNVSFQKINEKEKTVDLYAPVFKGVLYKIAMQVKDYVKEFEAAMPKGSVNPVFSCNCILNYLYSELEGKKTGAITGPITFGEVAYQLLNQTLVYLELK